MRLTKEQKQICDSYSAYRPVRVLMGGEYLVINKVNCPECPLVIDRDACLCLKNATLEDIEEHIRRI